MACTRMPKLVFCMMKIAIMKITTMKIKLTGIPRIRIFAQDRNCWGRPLTGLPPVRMLHTPLNMTCVPRVATRPPGNR